MQNDGTGKPKNGFVWTFVAADEHGGQDVAYVFAGGRSGETPKRLLGGTKGTLIVDGYSGYSVVAEVSKRKRAACHAHLRRYFHEALSTAPIAQEAIDLILGLYRVDHDAKEQKITGTKAHLRLRRQRAGPLRRVALGRKNYLFVGDVDAVTSIAGLYTLVATCEARGINPFAYLADIIPRVQDHPKRRLDELLPGSWARSRQRAEC
jgi:transposase